MNGDGVYLFIHLLFTNINVQCDRSVFKALTYLNIGTTMFNPLHFSGLGIIGDH